MSTASAASRLAAVNSTTRDIPAYGAARLSLRPNKPTWTLSSSPHRGAGHQRRSRRQEPEPPEHAEDHREGNADHALGQEQRPDDGDAAVAAGPQVQVNDRRDDDQGGADQRQDVDGPPGGRGPEAGRAPGQQREDPACPTLLGAGALRVRHTARVPLRFTLTSSAALWGLGVQYPLPRHRCWPTARSRTGTGCSSPGCRTC